VALYWRCNQSIRRHHQWRLEGRSFVPPEDETLPQRRDHSENGRQLNNSPNGNKAVQAPARKSVTSNGPVHLFNINNNHLQSGNLERFKHFCRSSRVKISTYLVYERLEKRLDFRVPMFSNSRQVSNVRGSQFFWLPSFSSK
jgi:hypothetical protein